MVNSGRLLLFGPVIGLALWLAGGCVNPMGADRTSARRAYNQITANAIGGRLSATTKLVLHRYGLEEQFAEDPPTALKELHTIACKDDRREILFALAGLNHYYATRLVNGVKDSEARKAPDYYLASAIYAWLYLFGDGKEPLPDAFDRRFRNACDFYNYGLALGFAAGPRTNPVVELAGGTRALGPGPVTVEYTPPVVKQIVEVEKYLPADEFIVRGFSVRDRKSGLGAPLVGVGKVVDETRFTRSVPATMFLRVKGNVRDWTNGLTASLELYSSYEVDSVEVAGRRIPLEADLTAPLAYALNQDHIWKLGMEQFFSPEEQVKNAIYFTQPYVPGRIPVIFVHGTFSSPVWWAEMWNTLRSDATLRQHFQFWNFVYNSGNPVAYSAAKLRADIDRKIQHLDPDGKDPALRQMVVIGHSQGGLLAELSVTESSNTLWRAVSEKDFDTLKIPAKDLEDLRGQYFFKPIPSVKRVVFISTPHRGSFLATSFVRSLAIHFIKLPQEVVRSSARALTLQNPLGFKPGYLRRAPSSLDDMSPNNPWLLALADLPTAEGVTSHSIIAIKGSDKPPAGSDGVVKYTSAHVDYAKSEFIVRSSHSCQGKPEVIEEVRRILLEHLAKKGTETNRVMVVPNNAKP